MNEKQRRFAEYYASNPNATEAAKAAGYSERTAYSQGQRLLKNVEVRNHIEELQNMLASERIASVEEVKQVWTEFLRSPQEKTANRIKAGELLLKSSGALLPPTDEEAEEDADNEGDIIIVPYNGRGGEPNAIRLASGEVLPLANAKGSDVLRFVDISDENKK